MARKRAILFQVHLDANEQATFDRAAELAGVATATWARERLRAVAIKELMELNIEPPILRQPESAKEA